MTLVATMRRLKATLLVAVMAVAAVPFMAGTPASAQVQDGLIAFATSNGIHVIRPDGSDHQLLLPVSGYRHPRWSPNGTMLTFHDNDFHDVSSETKVYVSQADGSGVRAVANGTHPRWMPDGRSIMYSPHVSPNFDPQQWMRVVNIDTGENYELPGVYRWTNAEISPDGARIVYESAYCPGFPDWNSFMDCPADGGAIDAFEVVALDGSSGYVVPTPWDDFYGNPNRWSLSEWVFDSCIGPDGFSDICQVNTETSEARLFHTPSRQDQGIVYSPTGTTILASAVEGLYLLSADGAFLRDLWRNPSQSGSNNPSTIDWQPVGGRAHQPLERLQGSERIATSTRVADAWPDGSAGAAVLARADVAADALAGTPLAHRANGPLLLTASDGLLEVTAAELRRVLPPGATVFLLGGQAALSAQVEDDVEALGFSPVRAAGADRFATAVAVAEIVGAHDRVFLADGGGFAEALVAGATAAQHGGVVLLTSGGDMPQATQEFLDEGDGEQIAVGPDAAAAAPQARAVAGADAYETAVALAQEFFPGAASVGVASGEAFPDGLSGGAHAARVGMPLVLSQPDAVHPALDAHLSNVAQLDRMTMYGGRGAIRDSVAVALHRHVRE